MRGLYIFDQKSPRCHQIHQNEFHRRNNWNHGQTELQIKRLSVCFAIRQRSQAVWWAIWSRDWNKITTARLWHRRGLGYNCAEALCGNKQQQGELGRNPHHAGSLPEPLGEVTPWKKTDQQIQLDRRRIKWMPLNWTSADLWLQIMT